MAQRRIEYLNTPPSQFVYESPAVSAESSDLFVSFRKVDDEKFDLIKSCKLIAEDPLLIDMTKDNTIYLDTVTNKKRTILKNQTRFLLAPILPKLKEQNIKYVLLFPSIMESYTKELGYDECFKKIGQEFKVNCESNNQKLVERLLEQRRKLAKYYEKLGFKSYDPCPGFKPDSWQLADDASKTMMNFPLDITYEASFELISYEHPDTKKTIVLKIPSQYWMIAKLDDLYKILFTDCIKERINKFKQLGIQVLSNSFNESMDTFKPNFKLLERQVELIGQLNKQIEIVQVDNFKTEFDKLNEFVTANKTEIEQLKESMVDVNFSRDLYDLIKFGQELSSGTMSTDGLAKCLSMAKEFEDRDIWVLNGGSSTGFYLKEESNYKRLYLKYKSKYLHSKHN